MVDQKHTKEHANLYTKVVQGGLWTVAMRVFVQGMSLVRYIVLARMLGKEDFGLLGISLLMMQTLGTFTNTGFSAALVQKKNDIRDYLDTAWTVEIIKALILCSVMFFAAPLMAMIKVPPEKVNLAVWVIRVMGLTLVIGALGNAGMVYLKRELDFGKFFLIDVCGTLLNVLVVIVIAVKYKTVWALVAGKLVGVTFRVVLSYMVHPYRPKLSLEWDKARELWSFGRWIFGSALLGFLISDGDDYFVWGYLGIASLGVYQLSYRLSLMPATEITNVISRITFPAYSKVQDDIVRLKDAYLKVLELSAFLSVPAAGIIFVMAPDFVQLFLKDKWLPAIPVIQVLSVRGLICSIGATRGPLFMAVGKPRLGVRIKTIKLIMLVTLIYPLTRMWGVVGTAGSIVLVDILIQPFSFFLTMRVLNCPLMRMLKPIVFPLCSMLVMVAVVLGFKRWVFVDTTYVSFVMLALICVCSFLGASYLLERLFGYRIRHIIMEQISVMKG